ncbi:MAG: TauD/TfdA family dioxygenase [Pseudomonadales bacterium]|jgi:taurine dioxygenase
MQKMSVEKLSGSLGGQVCNFDLSNITDDDFEQVAKALQDHQVMVFKRQSLSIGDHAALGKRFGVLHTHPVSAGVNNHPEILLLRNRGKAENITEAWHSDVSCQEEPPSISILQAIDIPPYGGDTIWANQYAALDSLSPTMRTMITPLRAVHRGFDMETSHPVVRTHPETGKQALYVNHGFTNRFDGMTRTESKPLLDYLVEVGSRADFTVRHSWAVGDIVMWDNRCVMHYAIHDYDDMPREMHRVTVCGERPA